VAWAGASDVGDGVHKLRVLLKATQVNLTSWSDVSARGSLEDVCRYLSNVKPGVRADLSKLYWRCQDASFYQGLVAYFREKMVYDSGVWKYALRHGDAQGVKEFLEGSSEFVQAVGNGIVTSFMTSVSLYRFERFVESAASFDHIEFGPFLSRRVHPISGHIESSGSSGANARVGGSGERILNTHTRQYFHELCLRLGMYPQLGAKHLLVLAYYMLLLDRTEDALDIFARFETLPESERSQVADTVQFDYLCAFIDFVRDDTTSSGRAFAVARRAVEKHTSHPNPRWSERFKKLAEVLEEHDEFEMQKLSRLEHVAVSDAPAVANRLASDSSVAATSTINTVAPPQVKLEVTVTGSSIAVTAQCLRACELLFYPIDVERMFSTDPFNTFSETSSSLSPSESTPSSSGSSSSMLVIEPRRQLTVDLSDVSPDEAGWVERVVAVPDDLASAQMMIRVREAPSARTITSLAPPADLTRTYFNSSLHVTTMPQLGMLQVLHDGSPVRSCYVKVYAKVPSPGSSARRSKRAEFYKDGYTDLLGKFDYVGINGDLIEKVEAFSVLVSHPRLGSMVTQASPPVLASTTGDFAHKEAVERLLF